MDKLAQDRSILNKIREKINVPGAMVEGFFKPELDRIMNDLRMADDNIRSILTGQKIGKADAEFTGGKSVKDLLKSARSNFNRREYMAGVADLGEFHRRMFDVTKFIHKLDLSINRIHHNFLFQNLDDKQKQNIKGLQEYMSSAAAVYNEPDLIKEAGIMDFFYNIGTKRGRALAIWEKKYPNVVKDLRDGGMRLLDGADSALANTLTLLKEMATARATRKVDDYMAAAKKIEREYARFDGGDKGFRSYYSNIILPYIKRQEQFEAEEAAKAKPTETSIPPSPGSSGPPTVPTGPPSGMQQAAPPLGGPPGASPPFAPPAQEEAAPDTQRSPVSDNEPIPLVTPKDKVRIAPQEEPKVRVAAAHRSFYNSLETMGKEDPSILSKYISKYATSIQYSDPATAIELFSIARKIKE
jgi:hypothetical protein